MDLNRIKDTWEVPGKYVVSAVVVLGLLYSILIRRSSEYVLKRRMKVVGTTAHVVEEQEILTEVVLQKYGSVRFRLIDDPKDGYFPDDSDAMVDVVYWLRLRGAGGLRYKGKRKPYWASKRLLPDEDAKSYELATRKFLEAKERNVQLDDTIR